MWIPFGELDVGGGFENATSYPQKIALTEN
jgi:hypothetical protein